MKRSSYIPPLDCSNETISPTFNCSMYVYYVFFLISDNAGQTSMCAEMKNDPCLVRSSFYPIEGLWKLWLMKKLFMIILSIPSGDQ